MHPVIQILITSVIVGIWLAIYTAIQKASYLFFIKVAKRPRVAQALSIVIALIGISLILYFRRNYWG